MQFLYVLASTDKDFYYEEFLLSLTSLKLFNPTGKVILLCDTATKNGLINKRTEYKKLIYEILNIDAPSKMNQVEVSRWLKTSMRSHIKGDFLFIDSDTVITDNLEDIFHTNAIFAAALDKHSNISTHTLNNDIIANEKKLGFTSYKSDKHYNSGVIFSRDTQEGKKIFDKWHELWLYGLSKKITRDQTSFNMAIYENSSIASELDGTWNCQLAYNGLPFLADSKIIHYFATGLNFYDTPFLLASKDILKEIKSTGSIPSCVLELLKNPRAAIAKEVQIISGTDSLKVLNSSTYQSLLLLQKKYTFLFSIINSFFSLLKNITKNILSKSSINHYN